MCGHDWVAINEVCVCRKCGLTLDRNTGKVILFDRRFANVGKKNSKKRRNRK